MIKEYRLIQIIESIDNITNKDITIFELTPITRNSNNTGYNFTPYPSNKNDYYVFDNSELDELNIIENKEEIIEIDSELFVERLIKTNDGYRKTFFSMLVCFFREDEDWYPTGTDLFENNKQIGFKFSHSETAFFTEGDNYSDDNKYDLIPTDYSDIKFEEETNYVVIDKNQVYFSFEKSNGIFTRIKGKVIKVEKNKNNRIISIETLSNFALSDNIRVTYEINSIPLQPLKSSENNIIVTVYGTEFQPYIRAQWSLFFGKFMGEVMFK